MENWGSVKGVYFKPWVGAHYLDGGLFSKRILVVGESHYCGRKRDDSPELTRKCVRWVIEDDWRHQFWTKIAIIFLNRLPSLEEKRDFWQSVAFYNFIQTSVGNGPRQAPTDRMAEEAKAPFLAVLKKLRPQLVLSLGKRLWCMLPEGGGSKGPTIPGPDGAETWWYPLGSGKRALAYEIPHPSRGFNGRDWHRPVFRALQLATR